MAIPIENVKAALALLGPAWPVVKSLRDRDSVVARLPYWSKACMVIVAELSTDPGCVGSLRTPLVGGKMYALREAPVKIRVSNENTNYEDDYVTLI